jgi:hypothetical protein
MPQVDAGGDLVEELLVAANEFDAVCEATSEDRPTSIHDLLASSDTRVVRVSAFCCAVTAHSKDAAELLAPRLATGAKTASLRHDRPPSWKAADRLKAVCGFKSHPIADHAVCNRVALPAAPSGTPPFPHIRGTALQITQPGDTRNPWLDDESAEIEGRRIGAPQRERTHRRVIELRPNSIRFPHIRRPKPFEVFTARSRARDAERG